MFQKMLENVRGKCPLIHNITNYVTVNDCANVLLAVGGSPTMASDPREVAETAAAAAALVCNLGAIDKVESMILSGQSANHAGRPVVFDPVGAGNTTKLANQIIVACNIQAVAEAFTLAQKAGVDPEVVYRAIRGGLAGSTVMDAKGPMMIAGNDKPGFKVDLHIKDLNNALDCAHTVGAPVPMTAEVQEILQWLHSNGKGQADHSAIAQYYEHLTGIKLGRDL